MKALRAFISIGIACLWLALCVPPMFMWGRPTADTGINGAKPTGLIGVPRIVVDRGSPAYRAGLRTGDALGCLSLTDARLLGYGAYDGRPISTCVRRGGELRHIIFVARNGPRTVNVYGNTAGTLFRLAITLVFFLTAIALVMLRPGLSTWLFFAYAIGTAPAFSVEVNGSLWPGWLYTVARLLIDGGAFTAVGFLLLFSICVPSDAVPAGWRRKAFFIALPFVALAAAFRLWFLFATSYEGSFALNYLIDHVSAALCIVVVVVRLFTMGRSERARFGWAAFAIFAGVIAGDLRNSLTPFPPYGAIAGYATVIMPLCLIYAILKRHVIDIRFALSRTVVYATLTTAVVAVIGAVDWASSAYLHEARVSMALDAAVTIGVAFALNRVHHWLEYRVDFLLFRKKYDAESFLSRLGRTLLSATQEETVDLALVRDPHERLDLTFAALYRNTSAAFVLTAAAGNDLTPAPAFDVDNELVRFLNTERKRLPLGVLTHHAFGRSAIALPVLEGLDLMGFAVYGIHRDGTTLDPDEIETLEHLCESAAQAYTHIEVSRYRAERAPLVRSPAV